MTLKPNKVQAGAPISEHIRGTKKLGPGVVPNVPKTAYMYNIPFMYTRKKG
jgi:hypothetical protein